MATHRFEPRPCCPDCGSRNIRKKGKELGRGRPRQPGDYRCRDCCYHFDDPDHIDVMVD